MYKGAPSAGTVKVFAADPLDLGPPTVPPITAVRIRHLHLVGDQPTLDDDTLTTLPPTIDLGAEATAIVEITFARPIPIDAVLRERKYYATTYLQRIGPDPLTLQLDGVTGRPPERATLRVGLGRDHDHSLQPTVTLNGHPLTVPTDARGYDQKIKHRFFGVLEIPVPPEALRRDNAVTLAFPDTGGHVSSVTLRTFTLPKKTP